MTPRDIIRDEASRLRPASIEADWVRAPLDRRDAIDDAIVYRVHRIAGSYLSGYPTPDVGAAIILGATPQDVAPGLTRAEASAYVRQTEHEQPLDYLAALVRLRHDIPMDARTDHIAVWRWVDRMMASSRRADALRRDRRLVRIDELTPTDLSDSVRDTYRTAEIRQALAEWDGPDELIPHEPWHDTLPKGVRVLRTAVELYHEGRHQDHCVGAYAERVYAGDCLIVSVESSDGHRSTAEVRGGQVVQHLGPRNEAPHPSCVALLAEVMWS